MYIADKPLQPQNVQLTPVDEGLAVSWDPPNELDGRPVDSYTIGYGKSMKTLRFLKVDKDRRSEVLEDVEPGVLHFLKMSAENAEGMSKPVYRAETPGGDEWVKLDGFAVVGGAPVNASSLARFFPKPDTQPKHDAYVRTGAGEKREVRPLGMSSSTVQRIRRPPQSPSGPRQPERPRTGTALLDQRSQQHGHHTQPQADQRNRRTPKTASESVYVVSLQAQRSTERRMPSQRVPFTKKAPPEPEEYEAKDISVRVMSPQSVLISWVDPAIEMQKALPGGLRHYTVKYREKGESARWEYKDTEQKRVLIDTLSADSMYEFSVRISQGDNHGKWCVSVFQRTPESAPSGPPENFEVKPLRGKGTAVTATWDPPEQPNGRIREYIMSYAPAMKPFGMKTVTYRSSTTSAIVDGLKPGDRYIFKIRATNRRGQGPQTKAFSVVMPGTASSAVALPTPHSKSQGSRRTSHTPSWNSKQDSYHDDDISIQSAEVTEEPTTPIHTTSALPTIKRTRPLSQSRSYHSIFSDVRGSVRKGATSHRLGGGSSSAGSKGRGAERADEKKEDKKTERTQEEEEEDKKPNNDAMEVEKKGVASPTSEEKDRNQGGGMGKDSPVDDTSDPRLKSTISISEGLTFSSKPSYPLRQPLSSRRFNSGRRQFSRVPSIIGSQTKTQDVEKDSSSSSPSHSQESAAIRKDDEVTNYPAGKNSYDQPSVMETKLNTPAPEQSIIKPGTEAPSAGKAAGLPGRGYSNGWRKPGVLSRGNSKSRVFTSVSTSQSTLPTGGKTLEPSFSQGDNNNYRLVETEGAKEEPTTSPPVVSTTHSSEEDMTTHSPTRINPFVNRHQSRFRPGTGSSRRVSSTRADGRVPWSRTASSSSVGAGRPILRGTLSRTAASEAAGESGAAGASVALRNSAVQETSKDAKTPSVHYPLKSGLGTRMLKPALPSRNTVVSESRNPIILSSSPSSGNGKDSTKPFHSSTEDISNNQEDYIYKESSEIEKVPDPTPALGTTTTTTATTTTSAPSSEPQSEASEIVDRDHGSGRSRPGFVPGSAFPRRPIIGSNGRVWSPLSTNRQTGSRFPLRRQPTQNTQRVSSNPGASSSSSFSSLSQPERKVSGGASVSIGGSSLSGLGEGSLGNSQVSSSSFGQGTRMRSDALRGRLDSGGLKPSYANSKNGRPNLTVASDKESSTSNENTKANGRRYITGPDGAKWVIDLDKGVLMNENGRILQDSQGRPRRVVMGEDGRTIFDHQGSPLVSQDGQALFGHGRDSQPVVNPKDKFLTVGGKPIIGLDRPKPRTTTTTRPPTTTMPPTTTTPEPTTLPTTTEMTTEESTTMVYSTCPPGTFLMRDDRGHPMLDADGFLDCYPEDELVPPAPVTSPFNNTPSNEFDLTGKKRFTAPYVNFIKKDPGAPCSLTEALEYLQVDVLENLMNKDSQANSHKQPPKSKPHNITVVAMEGCHSFVILDWAIPLKDDMVSGYMVHSASYDDVVNNRWSSSTSSGTHLAVENLKPNSRYYFKVQAKNVFGLGPVSDTLTYVTESDDPLLIERPPGGEPIWIPFSFRYNSQHSACKGSQYVKRTWYRKIVGVVLCNSLRYKIFMGDGLKEPFYSIADTFGHGEDHCQFVDSYLDGRTGSPNLSTFLPTAQGYYRSYRQEPVNFGTIGRRTPHPFVGWYECGVPIPGKW
ncbi:hypothetical protein UPYG_G00256290 [Umbra pygmaea]|uniref:Fibronectin type-III domain-containing protein n=1 Tax=Umbra pygmaea TaxID=75934 RepID=A0ABD0W8G8_UMBPY